MRNIIILMVMLTLMIGLTWLFIQEPVKEDFHYTIVEGDTVNTVITTNVEVELILINRDTVGVWIDGQFYVHDITQHEWY